MTIKITQLSEPTQKALEIICPSCGNIYYRIIPIDVTRGKDTCGRCGTRVKWVEPEGETK